MGTSEKAIFFDADGTLLSFDESIGTQYGGLLKKFGIELNPEAFDRVIGSVWSMMSEKYLNSAGGYRTSAKQEKAFWRDFFHNVCVEIGRKDLSSVAFQDVYDHFASHKSRPPRQDALRTIVSLKGQGYVVGVLSNHDARIKTAIGQSELGEYLDMIFTAEDIGFKKPALECFQYVSSDVGIDSSRLLMVGNDLHCDYHGAQSAGWSALLLIECSDEQPDGIHCVRDLSEVLSAVDKLGF